MKRTSCAPPSPSPEAPWLPRRSREAPARRRRPACATAAAGAAPGTGPQAPPLRARTTCLRARRRGSRLTRRRRARARSCAKDCAAYAWPPEPPPSRGFVSGPSLPLPPAVFLPPCISPLIRFMFVVLVCVCVCGFDGVHSTGEKRRRERRCAKWRRHLRRTSSTSRPCGTERVLRSPDTHGFTHARTNTPGHSNPTLVSFHSTLVHRSASSRGVALPSSNVYSWAASRKKRLSTAKLLPAAGSGFCVAWK